MLADVVDAEDRGATLERGDGRPDRGGGAPGQCPGIAEHAPEHPLAREPDEHGPAQPDDDVEPAQELEIVLDRLAEADPGVEPDVLLRDALGNREREAAIARGRQLVEEGAAILDIGGESTRPFSEPVPAAEELRRVVPVLERIGDIGAELSIDTSKRAVAAFERGASIFRVHDVREHVEALALAAAVSA